MKGKPCVLNMWLTGKGWNMSFSVSLFLCTDSYKWNTNKNLWKDFHTSTGPLFHVVSTCLCFSFSCCSGSFPLLDPFSYSSIFPPPFQSVLVLSHPPSFPPSLPPSLQLIGYCSRGIQALSSIKHIKYRNIQIWLKAACGLPLLSIHSNCLLAR